MQAYRFGMTVVLVPIFVLLPPPPLPEPVDLLPVDAADDLRLFMADLLGVVVGSPGLFEAESWFSRPVSTN